MKQYKVIYTLDAVESLRRIKHYIRRTDSDEKALYVLRELLKTVAGLKTLPNSHPVLLISPHSQIIYRYRPKWQFKIVFTVDESVDQVIILRLFHAKQNPEKLKEFLP